MLGKIQIYFEIVIPMTFLERNHQQMTNLNLSTLHSFAFCQMILTQISDIISSICNYRKYKGAGILLNQSSKLDVKGSQERDRE